MPLFEKNFFYKECQIMLGSHLVLAALHMHFTIIMEKEK